MNQQRSRHSQVTENRAYYGCPRRFLWCDETVYWWDKCSCQEEISLVDLPHGN